MKNGIIQITEYACQEIADKDAPIGIRKEYTLSLDERIPTDCTLAFYTVHQYVNVWLDGENVYQLLPPDNTRFSKTVGSNWVMIPIYREDAGKEVRIEITPVYESFRNREVDFLIGSELAIYKDRLTKDLPQLILGMMALLIDRGETGITKTDAKGCLWSKYISDNIYWTTMSRLKTVLEEAGIADIIVANGQKKFHPFLLQANV